jgi:predicted glycogen debranching enzyme
MLREQEARRRRQIKGEGDEFTQALRLAADQFIVRRADSCSVIAGYPWFSDWGRDTMISLPGLALATGRFAEAKAMLREFARHVSQGMLPNRFPDHGEAPEYNTVDATLWFFEAARAYVAASGDSAFFHDDLEAVFRDIIAWHERGTRYGIRTDADGLLRCGEPGVQLTWMDAKVGDWVVTPRYGKPVEIQALWYNALKVMEEFTGNAAYGERANQVAASFNRQFWNDAAHCLYDVVDGDVRDGSIRPNQVFAASLHYSMLSPERAAAVLETVRRELLTPFGLRTLSPYDPRYRGVYAGGVAERDGAYHQGTVWPWLIGPYVEAWRKVHGAEPDVLGDLKEHLLTNGVGQIPEIFDGDTPHLARGCFAQAWSVAELLRVTAGAVRTGELKEAAAVTA